MKQGVLVILLIATISVVGYALYQSNQERVTQLWQRNIPQTPQSTPTAPPAMTVVAQPTVVIRDTGPTQLPNTGMLDGGDTWSNTPTVALLIGLLITSTAVFWLGRRN